MRLREGGEGGKDKIVSAVVNYTNFMPLGPHKHFPDDGGKIVGINGIIL